MLSFIAYLVGYLTCYIELQGSAWNNWGGVAGQATILAIAIKILNRVALQPIGMYFAQYLTGKLKNWSYFNHHHEKHPSFIHEDCEQCNE